MFDGKVENRSKPKDLSGVDLLQQLNCLNENDFGKHPNKMKRKRNPEELNWTKKSIFFELPYWKTMKLRHNLDVMHIEKNICDNILGTMLNIEGKTKDTVTARLDLEDMKIKKELQLKKREDGSYLMPHACYTLSKEERKKFCCFLKKHKMEIQLQSSLSVEERHRTQFPLWFKNYVTNQGSKGISHEILSLAYGPDIRAQKYMGCIVNGVRFHTKARDEHLTSQNSGVTVEGNHEEDQINFYEMQGVENDDVSDADEDFEIYDRNMEMQISENISLHRNDIAANVIDRDIVDNVNILVNSDQESEDGDEGDEIESDE
ncbi:hypothetical protein V6N12_068558 [Hibiscus sabdariffa]|uniref:Uncharacterized protein n=1 Tax=Hibiscus sabdariffa TaxID=183260 RepID=A0ABR2FQN6_9ROSI